MFEITHRITEIPEIKFSPIKLDEGIIPIISKTFVYAAVFYTFKRGVDLIYDYFKSWTDRDESDDINHNSSM